MSHLRLFLVCKSTKWNLLARAEEVGATMTAFIEEGDGVVAEKM